jgi:hypothetical protein
MITADPPARLAAILEPLRELADEIVLAADVRVDAGTLAAYEVLADRLFTLEVLTMERQLGWLFSQCRGDWILRLDGDEVPSEALVGRLGALVDSRSARQFWIPRRWLYPDPGSVLAAQPWNEDFVSRLVRNDGAISISGEQHSDCAPVEPREYIDEPLYHLALLTASEAQRRDKALVYEAWRPGLVASGGGRINEAFYLPELRAEVPLREVPAGDRAAIVRALDGAGELPGRPPSGVTAHVSRAESDRLWEARPVSAGAYRAQIEPYVDEIGFAPAESRHVLFRVRNDGDELWPGGLHRQPAIRASYRWLEPDGTVIVDEGARTGFPRAVAPGEAVLMPLHVDAPAAPGEYLLEVDLVHEHVRWFGCGLRTRVRVAAPHRLPPAGSRLGESRPPRLQRLRRLHVPRVFHRVWLGDEPMPAEHERFGHSFRELHPGWEMKLWREHDLPALGIADEDACRARTHTELSNLMRYEILHRHGGVYVDTDVECLKPLQPLLRGIRAFAALELPGRVGNAVLAGAPGNRVFGRAARLTRVTMGGGAHSPDANGPRLLTLVLEQDGEDTAILPAALIYPYRWDEPERRQEQFPGAYTVHHWHSSSGRST